jgi:NADPH:quinone reductase-like Zn-dependent oxidoreductase
MKAIQISDYGGPEVLQLAEAPRPQPGPGQVLIRLRAAGVNPADWKFREGLLKEFVPLKMPWMPGLDGSGLVEAVGSGVTAFQPGDAVFGVFSGAYAEYAIAAATDVQLKPAKLTFEDAASAPVGALTAWGSLFDTANVQAGQRVLVQGAAGGVGLFAVQLARWKGATVMGTASAANVDFVRGLGAEAIDYTAGPFEQKVREVDVVLDTVGGDIPQRSLQTLRRGGTIVTVAAQWAEDFGKAQGVRAVRGGRTAVERLKDIADLLAAGTLKAAVQKVFPLADARSAHELSQTGHGRGRIVLRIAA